jgi:NAD(P) transhydrogenase
VLEDGSLTWPPPPGTIPAANTAAAPKKEDTKAAGPVDLLEPTKRSAVTASAAIAGERAIAGAAGAVCGAATRPGPQLVA